LRAIDQLLKLSALTSEAMSRKLNELHRAEKYQAKYLTLLNRMMFLAARNELRYKVLQHFYRLPEPVIQRFYGGRLTLWDKVRILVGRPPVPVVEALKVLRPSSFHLNHQNPS
jgi:lycopene beta-cyclase